MLDRPVLNLSTYFETHRSEYYARLQAVRERYELDEWVKFFAGGVEESALETAARIKALIEIRERYRTEVSEFRSGLPYLIDAIFENPILTVAKVQARLNVSQPTASSLLKKAQQLGWLIPLARAGRGGKQSWYAHEIWAATTSEKP